MRRKDREIKDFDEIIKILDGCKTIHLAMISNGVPYSVPVNFGYKVSEVNNEVSGNKKLTVYFHGAGEGKKIDALKENPNICFSAECNSQSRAADSTVACQWTTFYESVIGFGKVRFLSTVEEKSAGLDTIMFHYGYKIPLGIKKIAYEAMALAKTVVVEIQVEQITGKRHK